MKALFPLFFLSVSLMLHTGMARHGQYDEDARQQEKTIRETEKQVRDSNGNPVQRFASGVKEAAVDGTTGFISETAGGTRSKTPIMGTLEGANKGAEKILDSSIKGGSKIATLGFGGVESYDVEQPKADTDDTTKIKIKIPGT